MKPYPNVTVRELFSLFLEYFTFGFRLALVPLIVFTSCTPNTVQPGITKSDSALVNGSGAAEINNALATLAKQTALAAADYQIGPEDLLQLTLFNVAAEEFKRTPRTLTVRVSQRGFITLPLIGQLKVAGLTPVELEADLNKQYDKYFRGPDVGVLVAEYRQRVSVIGSVQKPGSVELTGPKTVIDILAMAGGVTDKAGTQVHIYRQGLNGRESHIIDLLALASHATSLNASNAGLVTMPMQSGDVINVPSAGMFFVDGAVKTPGSYPLARRYSLTQALATAGGVNSDFNSSDITIFRRKEMGSEIEPIAINLNEILAGSTHDLQIQADDVIVVPINSLKYAYHRVFGTLLGWGNMIGAVAGS